MPLYEYRCTSCHQTFQRLQPMGATASGVSCPHCGSEQVTRMVSTFASSSTGAPSSSGAGCGSGTGGGFT